MQVQEFPRTPLKVIPATVQLDESQIKEAIDEYVQKHGYEVGKVTISGRNNQLNGPDNFSAVVEVSPGKDSP